jgi:hypothetical protein
MQQVSYLLFSTGSLGTLALNRLYASVEVPFKYANKDPLLNSLIRKF